MHSHEVVEVQPYGDPGHVILTWFDDTGDERVERGRVNEGDYGELTNLDSPWFWPNNLPNGVEFRFAYEDPEWEPPPVNPDDPDYIEW